MKSTFGNIIKEIVTQIRYFFSYKTPLRRLITINIIVYVVLLFVGILTNILNFLFATNIYSIQTITDYLAVSSDWKLLLYRPWTIITSLFVHANFSHILFNMILLYFAGQIFMKFFESKKIYVVYLLGGIVGHLLYILSYNYFPVFESVKNYSVAVGASGAIMAIMGAIASKVPNMNINMWIANVKLKWIVLFFLIIDILSIPNGNSGGHFAHIGGVLFGCAYVLCPQFFQKIQSSTEKQSKTTFQSQRPKTDEQYNAERAEYRRHVDSILDKVAKSGYQSLTKEEKDFLFKTSQKKNW